MAAISSAGRLTPDSPHLGNHSRWFHSRPSTLRQAGAAGRECAGPRSQAVGATTNTVKSPPKNRLAFNGAILTACLEMTGPVPQKEL